MTDGETNTLASRWLEEPFFQLCCCVVSVFGYGGKKVLICLAGAQSLLRPEKKSSSRLSGGCAIVITTGKKSSSCLSGGCAIVITTGKKNF